MPLYEIGSFDDIRFISFEISTALLVSIFDFDDKNWFLLDISCFEVNFSK